jgi:predicted HAD superfamily hydrolase
MDTETFINPIKRVTELMPELIKNNKSVDLIIQMYNLSTVLLKELEFAASIELK